MKIRKKLSIKFDVILNLISFIIDCFRLVDTFVPHFPEEQRIWHKDVTFEIVTWVSTGWFRKKDVIYPFFILIFFFFFKEFWCRSDSLIR